MWLLIDDARIGNRVDVIARNSEAAFRLLEDFIWEGVSFDHDLGEMVSGYDILTWAIENELLPNEVELVTSNPAGRAKMIQALEKDEYKTSNNFSFKK